MSNSFKWTEEYSVHVAEMDEQHQQYLNICNDLMQLAENVSLAKQDAQEGIMKLGNYANYHLGSEEKLFNETQYPQAESHKKAHDLFRKQIQEFINSIRSKDADIKTTLTETATFAAEWLLNHILVVDKQYSSYLNEHGIH